MPDQVSIHGLHHVAAIARGAQATREREHHLFIHKR